MSHIYINCWRHMACDDFNRVIAAPMTPPLAELMVPITTRSKQSEPFPKWTSFITVKATDDCYLAFGEDPEACVGKHLIEAGEVRYYGVKPGDKVAVIGD